jgi:DNA-binding NarL/FixJ family response regulator
MGRTSGDSRTVLLTVVIVDDHAIFRQGLRLILGQRARGVAVVGEAENADQAVQVVGEARPDIVLLDLGLPKKSVRDLVERIQHACEKTRIIILTGIDDRDVVPVVARAGAKGFVLKNGAFEPLLEAIQHVARGDVWADPALSFASHKEFLLVASGGDSKCPLRALSARELDVIRLVADGFANRDVASRLSISEKTVTTHLNHIFDKLGVASRLQAALVYMRLAPRAS